MDPDLTMNQLIPSLVGGINVSQIAFSNWTKGSQNSLNWTLNGDFSSNYKKQALCFKTKLNSIYSRTNLNGNDYRTNEILNLFEKINMKNSV